MKTTASSFSDLSDLWSCLDFGAPELRDYATPVITHETRKGVALLSLVALLFLALAAVMSAVFALGSSYTYTYGVLCALALHIYLSSAKVAQLRALYLLAMLLLVVCGSSLVLLAPGETLSFDAAYKRADELLYEAKHAGGNTIRCGAEMEAAA